MTYRTREQSHIYPVEPVDWCQRMGRTVKELEGTPRWRLLRRQNLINDIEYYAEMCRLQEVERIGTANRQRQTGPR